MKVLKLIILGVALSISSLSQAQVSINVNVPAPPVWGPVVTTEQYYFLPEIESYYDIRQSQFIYLNNGAWVRTKSLPNKYKAYNLNNGQVVVLNDYRGKSPYNYYSKHKVKYFKGNKFKVKEMGGNDNKMVKHGNGGHKGKGEHKGNGKNK